MRQFSYFYVACFLFSPIIYAQEYDFENFSFEPDILTNLSEPEENKKPLTDYLFGEIGFVGAWGGFAQRQSEFIDVGADIQWDWGRFYANYGGVSYQVKVTQELAEDLQVRDDRPREVEIKVSETDRDWREAFVQLNLGSAITVTAGRQRNAWGQFELFSPATLMQPFTANLISFIPSKVDLLHAQDQVKIAIFPTSRSEIQFYDMENIRTDKVADRSESDILTPEFGELADAGKTLPLGDAQKQNTTQKAVRLLFYPSWGVLGFTRQEGVSSVATLRAPVDKGNYNDEDGEEANEGTNIISSVYDNDQETYLFFPKSTLNAIELAVSLKNVTLRAETATLETLATPDFLGNIGLVTEEDEVFSDDNITNFFNAIGDKSRGSQLENTPLFPATLTISTAGITYYAPVWTISLDIIWFGGIEPTTDAGREIRASYIELENESEFPNDQDFDYFPLISAYRTAGDDDRHYYGGALGVVGVGFGIGAIYNYRVNDDLSIGASIGWVDISVFEEDTGYSTKDPENPTLQFGVRWQF
ncbi:MAG: hypothetical protein K0U45_10305 [Alphaproteobacteria bacterium]|nr:hypothetical protein [Alphaproteobacteria bacterium]